MDFFCYIWSLKKIDTKIQKIFIPQRNCWDHQISGHIYRYLCRWANFGYQFRPRLKSAYYFLISSILGNFSHSLNRSQMLKSWHNLIPWTPFLKEPRFFFSTYINFQVEFNPSKVNLNY